MALLEIRNVSVSYKKIKAVSDISISANSGEIIGFIGADGAGKSSLMYAIAGIIEFDGEISYDNYIYHSPKESELIKPKMGFMPQGIGLVLYNILTVQENLDFFTNIWGIKKDKDFLAYRKRLLLMSGLTDFTDRLAGNLSGGMMQKLSLICTLLHRPKLLILDEPTTGVDPISRLSLWDILDDIRKKEGAIILVSTGYMEDAQKMDKILLFDEGKIIAQGTAKELTNSISSNTYKETKDKIEKTISFNKRTYSLNQLNLEYAQPSLEGLFFVNALKKNQTLSNIAIAPRENVDDIPDIVMQAKKISKYFGSFVADDKIDITLKRGEILGLLGANGAGKTTFIKMLLGLYKIDSGELILLDKSIKNAQDRTSLKGKIGYVSQHFALYDSMTIKENLLYFASMHGVPLAKAMERIKKYSYDLGFNQYMNDLPTELPLGVNQRFSIAAALLHEPVVLFLDEPTSGVDTLARAQFWKFMHKIKEKWGISILITTHYMSEAQYCDRIVLLKQGKKIADDTVENLYKDYPSAKSFEDIFLTLYRQNK